MEHVTFLIEDSGEQISCLLNPEKVVLKRQTGLVRRRSLGPESRGTTDDLVLRTGGGVTEIELDLLFDTRFLAEQPLESTTPDIRSETSRLWALSERSGDHERAATARLIWGKSWNIRVVVDALAERLEEFESTGEPKRSWLRVRLLRVPEDPPPRTTEESSGIGSISDAEPGLQLENDPDGGEPPSQLPDDLSSEAALETGLVDWACALREQVAEAAEEEADWAASSSNEPSLDVSDGETAEDDEEAAEDETERTGQDGAGVDVSDSAETDFDPQAPQDDPRSVEQATIASEGADRIGAEPTADALLEASVSADDATIETVEPGSEASSRGWRAWAETWVIRPATVALDLIEATSLAVVTLLGQGVELLVDEMATWGEKGEAALRGSLAARSDEPPLPTPPRRKGNAPARPLAPSPATRGARVFWEQREQLGRQLARYGSALRKLLADSVLDARLEELRLQRELQRMRRKGGLSAQLLEPYFAPDRHPGQESAFSPGTYAARLYTEVEEQTTESGDAMVKLEVARTLANLQQASLAKQLQSARAEEALQRDPIAVLLRRALAGVQDKLHALREGSQRGEPSSSELRVDLLVVWSIVQDLQRDTRVSIQAALLTPTSGYCLTRLADDLGAELQDRMRGWMTEIRAQSEVNQSPQEPTRWDQLALAEFGSVSAWRRLAIRRDEALLGARS